MVRKRHKKVFILLNIKTIYIPESGSASWSGRIRSFWAIRLCIRILKKSYRIRNTAGGRIGNSNLPCSFVRYSGKSETRKNVRHFQQGSPVHFRKCPGLRKKFLQSRENGSPHLWKYSLLPLGCANLWLILARDWNGFRYIFLLFNFLVSILAGPHYTQS